MCSKFGCFSFLNFEARRYLKERRKSNIQNTFRKNKLIVQIIFVYSSTLEFQTLKLSNFLFFNSALFLNCKQFSYNGKNSVQNLYDNHHFFFGTVYTLCTIENKVL